MWLDRNTKLAIAVLLAAALFVPLGLWWDNHRISRADSSYQPTSPMKTRSDVVTAAFIGDYYTAVSDDSAYWKVASAKLCWKPSPFGVGGTGYTTPAANNFVSRIDAVVATNPDIVVVEGSTNDRDSAAIGAAARELFATLRQRLPDATVIAVGPVTPLQSRDEPTADRVRALRDAAKAIGVVFIDATEFLPADESHFQRDEILPSEKGLRTYSEKFVQSLPAQLNQCK